MTRRLTLHAKAIGLLLAVTATAACSPCIRYSGDGNCEPILDERGGSRSGYRVQFDAIDPTRTGEHSYDFGGLSGGSFTVALRVTDRAGNPVTTDEYGRPDLPNHQRPNPVVAVSLITESGDVVIKERRALREWDWSRSRADIDGEGHDQKISAADDTRFVRVGEKAHNGWGTHFTPRSDSRYRLKITVVTADPPAANFLVTPVIEIYTW
jgi:hypothetical protein